MKKMRVWLMALAVVLVGMVVLQREVALAECRITSSSGDDSVVACANPADTDGISTGSGNDIITVEADTRIDAVSGISAIDAGPGDDKVYQYGHITSPDETDAIEMQGGNDLVENYGTIDTEDDGIRCAPVTGTTCTIRNFGTITSVFEGIDVTGRGGIVVINNTGNIDSSKQEGMHLLSEINTLYMVNNYGRVSGGHQGVEVSWGRLSMHNYGTVISTAQVGLKTGGQPDWLDNTGLIEGYKDSALVMGPGTDTLLNSGTLTAPDTKTEDISAVSMESGDDLITTSGDIFITGDGLYGIEGGTGSDTVTIQGGTIDKLIFGDDHTGSNLNDYDILKFEFTGDAGAVANFRYSVNAQTPQSGSATWNGKTYRWSGFEEIRMDLTVDETLPTSTPMPTNTPVPSAAPTLDSPSDGAVSDKNRFRLVWSAVSGAKSYELQVSRATTFSVLAVQESMGGTKKSVKLDEVGWYYWRVRVLYPDGAAGPWSEVHSLGYGVQPQGGAPAPGLTAPANGAVVSKAKVNLEWIAVPGAMQYQVQMAASNDFSSPTVDTSTTKTKFGVTLAAPATFYWRVRAQYRDGSAGAWSPAQSIVYSAQASQGVDVQTVASRGVTGTLTYGDLHRRESLWVLGWIAASR